MGILAVFVDQLKGYNITAVPSGNGTDLEYKHRSFATIRIEDTWLVVLADSSDERKFDLNEPGQEEAGIEHVVWLSKQLIP